MNHIKTNAFFFFRLIFLSTFILFSISCYAENYTSTKLSDILPDNPYRKIGKTLTITSDRGSTYIINVDPDKIGFEDVKISSNKQLVGWLVNELCCGSNPLPTSLVIFKNGKIFHTYDDQSIFSTWQFKQNDTAIGFSSQTAHFSTGVGYSLYNLSNNKLIKSFGCEVPFVGQHHKISKNVPSWVWSLREKGSCPYTDINLE